MVAGRFERGRLLGKGGMGTVYEAEDTVLGRSVALKFLRPELADDPEMVARFQREVRAIGRLQSPNVVAVHDVGSDPDAGLFMVLERLDGESLHDVIVSRGPLSIREACAIAGQTLAALRAAHEAKVIHRDLKPDNVFVLRDGSVKVLDFGIAHLLEGHRTHPGRDTTPDLGTTPSSPTLTRADRVLGTPLYIAPEQLTKQPPGPATDLYSLGVVLFEMIAGRPPFESLDAKELCDMHLAMPPPPLTSPNGAVPADLVALVAKMLAKSPGGRPTASKVAEILARHASDAPPIQTPGLPVARWLVMTLGALAVLGVVAYAGMRPESPHAHLRPAMPVQEPPPLPEPAPEPEPDEGTVERLPTEVTLEVAGLPSDAELRWDGDVVSNPWTTAEDDEAHRLEVVRGGRLETFEVVPDEDRVIELPTTRRRTRRRREALPAQLREW